MGTRLTGFDYARPYFYMVTIRCHAGVAALSRIVAKFCTVVLTFVLALCYPTVTCPLYQLQISLPGWQHTVTTNKI